MPYGHNKQYRKLVLEAQRKRLQITRQQQQQIARLYRDIAKDMGKEIAKKSEKTLTYRWLKDYAKALKNQSKILYSDIQGIVSLGILNTAEAFVDAEQAFWSGLVPGLSERFRDTFSSIPQACVDELMNGGIYKDFTGLSERIWAYQKKYDRDIGYMIERGIVAQKSAYELAKDLEMYVNPKAKKPWEWQKVYPNCNRVVDYNAQRLARTSVTHAYQLSFQRATKDNPFVEQYQWNSSNAGKTCAMCAKRDGKLFDKDKLPLDHPNGMCVVTAVISKELDEIAEELNDWANGESNPALDKWLVDSGNKAYENKGKTLKRYRKESILEPEDKGDLFTDLNSMSENLLERSLQVNNFLNSLGLPESEWSGRTIVKSISDLGRSLGKKKKNCDIWLREDAPIKTIIHEHLHARSSSRMIKKFRKYRWYEEGACELLAEEICKKNGIKYKTSYEVYVDVLREFNKISGKYEDIYDFAIELFKIDMDKREQWLRDILQKCGRMKRIRLHSLIKKLRYEDE
ncbi:MAG: hypothetical protein KHY96_10085 [Lachnospiraceae bacterium]|nr:hypothetical protein [Lachnospiraceae bacterium]